MSTTAPAEIIDPVERARSEQPEALHELQQRALRVALEIVLPGIEAELAEEKAQEGTA